MNVLDLYPTTSGIFKLLTRSTDLLQVAAVRKEAAKWQELEESKLFLETQVSQFRTREQQEAARANELAAQVARLQSQLAAAKLDVQTAREQAAVAAIEAPVSILTAPHACYIQIECRGLLLACLVARSTTEKLTNIVL